MSNPLIIGPMIVGQEAFDAEVARLAKLRVTGGGLGIGSRVLDEPTTVPAITAAPAAAPKESLSYSDAMELLDSAPEELERVVRLELARTPAPRKSVLQLAARKARAAENDVLLTEIEAALEALS